MHFALWEKRNKKERKDITDPRYGGGERLF